VVNKLTKNFIIWTFVLLYILTSCISTIHVIDFFKLSNPEWLAITLAVAFEVGAAASLASIIALKKMNKGIVWALFFVLTAMQAMGNTFYAFTHLHDFQNWVDLFGLGDFEVIAQKRILSIVSGAVLPLVALGFIKSLVDYIKPEVDEPKPIMVMDGYADPSTPDVYKPVVGVDLSPVALDIIPTPGIPDDVEPEPELEPEPVIDETQVEKNKLLDQIRVFK